MRLQRARTLESQRCRFETWLCHPFFFSFFLATIGLCCCAQALVAETGGFSCRGTQALGMEASVIAAHGLGNCCSWAPKLRLRSHGALAEVLHSMWDFPRPGTEPMSGDTGRWIPTHCATRKVLPPFIGQMWASYLALVHLCFLICEMGINKSWRCFHKF